LQPIKASDAVAGQGRIYLWAEEELPVHEAANPGDHDGWKSTQMFGRLNTEKRHGNDAGMLEVLKTQWAKDLRHIGILSHAQCNDDRRSELRALYQQFFGVSQDKGLDWQAALDLEVDVGIHVTNLEPGCEVLLRICPLYIHDFWDWKDMWGDNPAKLAERGRPTE
jgi:hypothetical protein